MRAVLQRVLSASVTVENQVVASIGGGLLVLVGKEASDTEEDLDWLAKKIVGLRLFKDETGEMNRSVLESGGEVLVVSQFTLFASTKKGTRPSWHRAASPGIAFPLYEALISKLGSLLGRPVAAGRFGAMMQVASVNDGPVTLIIDTKARE
jgi:D-tyrosyl-tRNA(Tyr) deacylase